MTTSRTDPDGLAALVERARDAVRLRPADPDFPGLAPPAPVSPVDHWDDATAGATPDQRAEVVAGFVAAAGDFEAAGYCMTRATEQALASTTGQRAAGRSTRAQVDGIHRGGGRRPPADGYAQATSVRLADLDGPAVGARAAAKAGAGLDPVSLEPGAYEVVLEPKAVAAALLYPAPGLLRQGPCRGPLLRAAGRAAVGRGGRHLGRRPRRPGTRARLRRRGHAQSPPGHRAGGRVRGLTHDRRSAHLAGVESTGHSNGFDAQGGTPSNLFFGAATWRPSPWSGR